MQPTKDGERWTIASDFRSVDELFKTLKRGPYAYLNEWTAERMEGTRKFYSPINYSFLRIRLALFSYPLPRHSANGSTEKSAR